MMNRLLMFVGLIGGPLLAGALFQGGTQAGWLLLLSLGMLVLVATHAGAFFAGIVLARRLLNDGAMVASASAESDAKKARAYSDVLVTGMKTSQQLQKREPAAQPPMLGAGGFVIQGLDQDYEAFDETF